MSRELVETVSFRVDGDYLTDYIRSAWREGSFIHAWKVWASGSSQDEDGPATSCELFLKLVTGKLKLEGSSSDAEGIAVVEDNSDEVTVPSWELALKYLDTLYGISELRVLTLTRGITRTLSEEKMHPEERTELERILRSYINQQTKAQEEYIRTHMIATGKLGLPTGIGKEFIDSVTSYYTEHTTCLHLENWHKFLNSEFKLYDLHIPTIETEIELVRSFTKSSVSKRGYLKQLTQGNDLQVAEDPEPEEKEYLVETPVGTIDVGQWLHDVVVNDKKPFQPEDLKTTKYTSGFLDREGNFYGCGPFQHVQIERIIVLQFKLKAKKDKDTLDWNEVIEDNGWIKVSVSRFYWNYYQIEPSKDQIDSIMALMTLWNITHTEFLLGGRMTLAEALEENKQELRHKRIMDSTNEATKNN